MIDQELEELKDKFIPSEEEFELLQIRKILDKIYVDKTIILHNTPKRTFPEIALVIDLTQFPLIWCDTCKEFVTYEATGHEKGYVHIRCDTCKEQLLHLKGNR